MVDDYITSATCRTRGEREGVAIVNRANENKTNRRRIVACVMGDVLLLESCACVEEKALCKGKRLLSTLKSFAFVKTQNLSRVLFCVFVCTGCFLCKGGGCVEK